MDSNDPTAVLALAERLGADLTVVGPEAPLAAGIADHFAASRTAVVRPTRAAAQLETSKAFAKDFMARHGVPTARYRDCHSADDALRCVRHRELGEGIVVKADGLAAGKGVVVGARPPQPPKRRFEPRWWTELSVMPGARSCWKSASSAPKCRSSSSPTARRSGRCVTAQDHKRIFDDDQGPNTGGMGAFAPSPLVDEALQQRIESEIVKPVLAGWSARACRSAASCTAG